METRLTTDRMSFRPLTGADVDDLLGLHTDPEVMRFLGDERTVTRRSIEYETLPAMTRHHTCLGGPAYVAAEQRTTGVFLGWFELHPGEADDVSSLELGYRLGRAHWGRGYATEGSQALVHHAFATLSAQRVHAETMAVNSRSRRVMEKAGLRHVRTFFPSWPEPLPGSEQGEVEYALTREEWRLRR